MSDNMNKEAVVDQVVEAIADVEDTDAKHLEIHLHNYVSTDAIRDLVTHDSDAWRLQFETENHIVEITGNDTILVDGTTVQPLT